MYAPKLLIRGVIVVFGFGAGYDVLVDAGVIKGDGHDHTVPSVAIPAMTSTQTSVTYVTTNTITGDDYRRMPWDHRQYRYRIGS